MPDDFKLKVKELMLANRRSGEGFAYTVPSPSSYPYQWLWDSCFHAIILADIDLPAAKAELLTLTKRQFRNGMIPHMIYWEEVPTTSFPHIAWGKESTSSITQPPMLAYAAWQLYERDHDKQFLKELYPAMCRFYNFFFHHRDPKNHKLIGIINPDESGEDNSPRFDTALGLPAKHESNINFAKRLDLIERNRVCDFTTECMSNFYWVRDVSFNSIFVRNLRDLANISRLLGHEDSGKRYDELAQAVTVAMRLFMMRPDSIMFSTYGLNYRKINVLTWAIFMPLFARILTPDEAKVLVAKHLLNPEEFATEYGVPTVALNQLSFDPSGFWRGPVWIGANWFIYHGLLNYGFKKEAEAVAQSTQRLVQKSGFREYFNPLTGEGYGAENFTWPGLLLDMQSK